MQMEFSPKTSIGWLDESFSYFQFNSKLDSTQQGVTKPALRQSYRGKVEQADGVQFSPIKAKSDPGKHEESLSSIHKLTQTNK